MRSLISFLNRADQFLEVGNGQFGVVDVGVIAFVLESVDDHFKRFVVFAGTLLHVHHDVAVHLDETAIAVPGEALVLGGVSEGENGFVVEAEIENGVHHAGHGIARTGADGNEHRHLGLVAELGAHDLFNGGDGGLDLGVEYFGIASSCCRSSRCRLPW